MTYMACKDDPSTGYIEGVAILAAVLIVAVVTALNDYEKERQFESLSEENDNVDAVVLRDGGTSRQISVRDIVVGDVVCVEAGDQIPCDGVLLSCDGLELDESALTGEPIDIDKDLTRDPFVLSGCTASAGAGTYVATAVGRDSQWGVIKSHLEKEQEQTPLQEKLDDMAALIGYVGIAAALATFGAMMIIKLVVRPAYLDDVSVFNFALDAFIIGVTIVVVAVPEGLPLAVTISLAYSTKKMLADQNLIRHLHACETMGNATNICSDKTGTLTQNRMTVVRGWFANTVRNTVPGDGASDDPSTAAPADISPAALDIILQGIATCSTARIVPAEIAHKDDDPDGLIHDTRPVLIGNKTEAALLALAVSSFGNGDDYAARRAAAQFGKSVGSRLFPFSSLRKRMSVIVNEPVGGGGSSERSSTPSRRRLRSKNGNGGAGVPTTGDGRMPGLQRRTPHDEDSDEEDHGFALGEGDYEAEHEVDEDIFRGGKTKSRRPKLLAKVDCLINRLLSHPVAHFHQASRARVVVIVVQSVPRRIERVLVVDGGVHEGSDDTPLRHVLGRRGAWQLVEGALLLELAVWRVRVAALKLAAHPRPKVRGRRVDVEEPVSRLVLFGKRAHGRCARVLGVAVNPVVALVEDGTNAVRLAPPVSPVNRLGHPTPLLVNVIGHLEAAVDRAHHVVDALKVGLFALGKGAAPLGGWRRRRLFTLGLL